MSIKSDEYNNVLVLAPSGDLSGEESVALRKHAEATLELKPIADVVLDLEKVGFIDSEGLEALLWLKRRCEDLFGSVKLAGPDENVKKILEVTRLEHRFECHADLPAALKNAR